MAFKLFFFTCRTSSSFCKQILTPNPYIKTGISAWSRLSPQKAFEPLSKLEGQLKTTDNLLQPDEHPWKMCLWSKMSPGKPHEAPQSLQWFIFCCPPHPPPVGEWGTLLHWGLHHWGQPFLFHFSTGVLSAPLCLTIKAVTAELRPSASRKAISLGRGVVCCN